MKSPQKFEESLAQLETLIRKMQSGNYSIDEITDDIKTARQLIKNCKERLTDTEAEIEKLNAAEEESQKNQ